jgi:hypothetical protein
MDKRAAGSDVSGQGPGPGDEESRTGPVAFCCHVIPLGVAASHANNVLLHRPEADAAYRGRHSVLGAEVDESSFRRRAWLKCLLRTVLLRRNLAVLQALFGCVGFWS